MPGLTISREQIDVHNDQVVISSNQLTQLLIHKPQDVLDLLSLAGGVVQLSDISVDDAGRIVIDHPGFHDGLLRALAAEQTTEAGSEDAGSEKLYFSVAGTNTVCGMGC